MTDTPETADARAPFQREERYIVIKHNKLTALQAAVLRDWLIPTVDAVVVEADWPEYETVWRMIEDRVTAKALQSPPVAGGSVPAGMKPYGPDHLDYPAPPKDYAVGPVVFRKGTSGDQARVDDPTLLFSEHTGGALDVIAYTAKPKAAAPEAATPSAVLDREAIARALYDAWPHTVFSAAIAEATGLPLGERVTWEMASKAGADFTGLYRYADAVVAFLAGKAPSAVGGDRMREALAKAYAAGAEEVHSYWKECRPDIVFESEPDFTEAASDYGRHASEALATGETSLEGEAGK